jgi:hypothetical protein
MINNDISECHVISIQLAACFHPQEWADKFLEHAALSPNYKEVPTQRTTRFMVTAMGTWGSKRPLPDSEGQECKGP